MEAKRKEKGFYVRKPVSAGGVGVPVNNGTPGARDLPYTCRRPRAWRNSKATRSTATRPHHDRSKFSTLREGHNHSNAPAGAKSRSRISIVLDLIRDSNSNGIY